MRSTVWIAVGLLAITACADEPAASNSTVARVVADSTPEQDGLTGGRAPVSEGTVQIETDGITWSLPRSACLLAPGDLTATADAAIAAAEEVRNLVADRASGWPTTTAPMPGDEVGFFVEVNRDGPIALALGSVAGNGAAIVAEWSAFEQRYADSVQGWGPVTDISTRLPAWQETAATLVASLPSVCG